MIIVKSKHISICGLATHLSDISIISAAQSWAGVGWRWPSYSHGPSLDCWLRRHWVSWGRVNTSPRHGHDNTELSLLGVTWLTGTFTAAPDSRHRAVTRLQSPHTTKHNANQMTRNLSRADMYSDVLSSGFCSIQIRSRVKLIIIIYSDPTKTPVLVTIFIISHNER